MRNYELGGYLCVSEKECLHVSLWLLYLEVRKVNEHGSVNMLGRNMTLRHKCCECGPSNTSSTRMSVFASFENRNQKNDIL